MRKLAVFLLVAALALFTFISPGRTAPALGDKPVRYEYAELQYARTLEGPGAQWGGGNMPAQLGGRGPGGGGVPAFAPAQPATLKTAIRWTTAEEQVEVKEWEELADKLKAPAPKKESPATVHKLRVLNRLSDLGWEVMDRGLLDTSPGTLALLRKLP
jgi:hypothetical protein